ncbi:MAG: M48 family metalloprotease [Oscillospiraceae bacterium]|nr:M48 family metalloprotease [Oscillospiraceae bacterium]
MKKKVHQFWERLKSEGLLLWKWFKPYLLKLPLFLWHNKLYILWFVVYDYVTIQLAWLYQYLVHYERINEYSRYLRGETIDYKTLYYIQNPTVLVTFLLLMSIGIALLFGDAILRTLESIRPIETEEEKEYLIPLFEELCEEVKEAFPKMKKTKLYIIDNQAVNAKAVGVRTIAVTQGAVRTFSREELKAILAHEMAHIYHGNSMAIMLNTIGNGIFSVFILLFRFILLVLDFLQAPFEQQTKGIIHFILDFIGWIVTSLQFVFLFVGNIILMGNSRSTEYKADEFAYMAGYGAELKEALYMLQKMTLTDQLKIVERMQASHPRVSRRIMKLEKLLAKE